MGLSEKSIFGQPHPYISKPLFSDNPPINQSQTRGVSRNAPTGPNPNPIQVPKPARTAMRAAWVRSVTPNLVRIELT
jgi:hypothetical protein